MGQFKKMQELMAQKRNKMVETKWKRMKKVYKKDLKRHAEDEILRNADVICTTCVSAFD